MSGAFLLATMNQPTTMIDPAPRLQTELDCEPEFNNRAERRWAVALAVVAALVGTTTLVTFLLTRSPSLGTGKSGSFVVLMRHADAPGRNEPENFTLADCSTQRNLSDKGRIEAREAGTAFRAQAFNVGAVISSRWCRTRETAQLLGFSQVREEQAFDNLEFNKEHADDLLQAERDVIQNWQGPGILVVITHSSNIKALTGLEVESNSMIIAESKKTGSIQFRPSSIVLKDLFS